MTQISVLSQLLTILPFVTHVCKHLSQLHPLYYFSMIIISKFVVTLQDTPQIQCVNINPVSPKTAFLFILPHSQHLGQLSSQEHMATTATDYKTSFVRNANFSPPKLKTAVDVTSRLLTNRTHALKIHGTSRMGRSYSKNLSTERLPTNEIQEDASSCFPNISQCRTFDTNE